MMNQPIYNPPVPYVGLLPGGSLQPKIMIKIDGTVSHSPNAFSVNLQLGPRVNPRDDLALHLSAVFTPPQRVVRNSLQSLTWGAEESHGGFPFSPGSSFQIIILCEYDCYKIAINGFHFTEFRHRLPYQHASHLTIDGDCHVNSIVFETLGGSGASPHHHQSAGPMPPYPAGGAMGGLGGVPPYPTGGPTSSGSYVPPPMPQYQGGGAYAPGPAYNQYPTGNQPYPTQPGASFVPPPNVYPSGSGAYMAGPSGYVKPKKNKGMMGSGLLPAAGAIGGTLLGASLLSSATKKIFKGPKLFGKRKGFGMGFGGKHKGFGGFGKHKGGFFGGKHKFGGKFKGFKGPKW